MIRQVYIHIYIYILAYDFTVISLLAYDFTVISLLAIIM